MPKLELLASGPGTGKTTYCIDLFRKEILRSPSGIDSRAYFILPNREHAGRIQNLILKKELPGLFNVHILTIQDLGLRLFGANSLPRPGDSLRRSVLRRILEDPSEKWDYFSEVKDLPGFYELLSERIQEFCQAQMGAEEFSRRSKNIKDPVFRVKAGDFERLMRRADAEFALRGFSEEMPVGASLNFGPGPAPLIILDGFYHFTQAQKTLIATLADSGARMVAALTLPESAEKRAHVFELVESTREFLIRAGFKKSEAVRSKNRRVTEPALLHLERSLFLPRPGRLAGAQQTVKLLTAETVHDEIEEIAREIRRLHRETDWHFSDMALVLRSMQGYEKTIAAVFSEYGIPVSMHERRKTVETGLGRFAHRLLALFLSEWQGSDLFALLKSGYAPFRPTEKAAAELERAAFAKNIRSGRESWTALSAEIPASQASIEALTRLEKGLFEGSSARVFRSRFAAFLNTCCLDPGSGDAGALRALENLLVRSEAFYAGKGAPEYSAQRFAEEFRRGIEVGLFSEKPMGKNRVQVYDAVMALPKEYRVVFAAGLLDQRFPQPVNEDPFFKDDERAILNGNKPRLELRSSRRSGERYFFYMAVTRAKNRLYLSYPRKDRDGRSYLPSVFVEEVRRCFTELPHTQSRPDAPVNTALWVADRQAEKAAAGALFARDPVIPASEKKKILAYASNKIGEARFAGILSAGFRDTSASLKDPRILKALRAASIFSPTRIEEYLTCAFKYFSDQVLKLKPYLEDRLRAETGTMLHAVLETYYSQNRDRSQLFSDLEKEFEKSPLSSEPLFRRKALLERARRTLELFLRRETKDADERGFVPSHFELAFGKKRDGSPAELPYLTLGNGEVRIGGFIDRVDISPDGRRALVIDYKLGQRDLRKKLDQEIEVQLPLYLLAVQKLMGLEPAGAELHFLESGKKAALPQEGLEDLLRLTEERAVEAARRIREGDISIVSKSCKDCNFSAVCRYETWKLIYAEADRV